MIIDKLENISFYAPILPNLEKGMKAISDLKKKGAFAPGRYDFEGGFFKVEMAVRSSLRMGRMKRIRSISMCRL